jgi:protein arginine kinase
MSGWFNDKGPESDIVISSRVRLARNLKDYPFPWKMSKEQETSLLNRIREAFMGNGSVAKSFLFLDIQSLGPIDRHSIVEKHLISPELAESSRICGALISRDEKISIMVNEEDHLRIQALFGGLQIDKALGLCSKVDTYLEEKMDFAFDNRFGYLTCCPTNIGTGIRASAMLHLPALTMTGYIRGVLDACTKLGIAVRGLYGENSEASGNMYQISNQVTLGLADNEIVTNINHIAFQIIEQERTLRSELFKQNPSRMEDKVYRSLGIFSHARIMSTEEGMKLLSDVRLGVDMGIIKNINTEILNELLLLTQPATLQKMAGGPLGSEERDIMRAEVIRKKLIVEN